MNYNGFLLFFFFGSQENLEPDFRSEFRRLRVHYLVGKSRLTGRVVGTTRNGHPKYETVFWEAIKTDLGDLEPEDWEHRARALIERYGEQGLFLCLLEYAGTCAWLRRDKDRERYALELHMSRIFENPEWVGYEEFHTPTNEIGDDFVIDKAIAKINAEMQKNPSNVYMEIIGHYIIDRCTDEVTAARVAEDGKTLGGAMSAVTAAAQKIAVNNVAALTPEPVFDAVDRYFGLKTDNDLRLRALMVAPGGVPTMPAVPPSAKRVELDLEDFF